MQLLMNLFGVIILIYWGWLIVRKIEHVIANKLNARHQVITEFTTSIDLDREFYEIINRYYDEIEHGYQKYGFEAPAAKNLRECQQLFAQQMGLLDRRLTKLNHQFNQLANRPDHSHLPIKDWSQQIDGLERKFDFLKTTIQNGPFAYPKLSSKPDAVG